MPNLLLGPFLSKDFSSSILFRASFYIFQIFLFIFPNVGMLGVSDILPSVNFSKFGRFPVFPAFPVFLGKKKEIWGEMLFDKNSP